MKANKKSVLNPTSQKKQAIPFFEKSGKNSFFQVQPKLKIGSDNDQFEQEAEKKSDLAANEKSVSQKSSGSFSQPKIQTKSNTSHGVALPFNFQNQLQKTEGQGQQLPADSLKNMNTSFGKDFSNVKIHTNSSSEQLNQSIQAKAFTHKNNIYFNEGNFKPNTKSGKKLLAHELTHVVHQQFSSPQIQRDPDAEAKKKAAAEIAKEKETIISTYKLKGIVKGDKSWTLEEINQLKEALEFLPDEDKIMIEGVEFKRMVSLSGSAVGQFEAKQSVVGETVTNDKTIQLENGAFGINSTETNLIIVHEVGHAVASFERREAVFEQNIATAENNKLEHEAKDIVTDKKPIYDDFDKSRLAYDALLKAYEASTDKTKKAKLKKQIFKDHPRLLKKQAAWKAKEEELTGKNEEIATAEGVIKSKKDLADKTMISADDLKRIESNVATAKSGQTNSLATATKKIGDNSTTLKTEANAYTSSIDALNKGIEDMSTKTHDQTMDEEAVEELIEAVNLLAANRGTEKINLENTNKDNPALMIYSSVETTQDAWYDTVKAQSLAHNRKARVQKFVHFVDINQINPITLYAKKNWPHKPEEFYAEAYSWFFTKPAALKKKSAKLHQWFADGNYKK
ncbi:MAG: DUF4157 domain-containing protein [Saprospiraceae bacterium]